MKMARRSLNTLAATTLPRHTREMKRHGGNIQGESSSECAIVQK